MSENPKHFFEFGEFRLDPVERRLLRDGRVIPLTPKAFETLCLLVENGGHLLEKNHLMEMLWADAFVEEGNLADNVSKIRQALGDSRKEPKFIETISGRGYRFVAEVRRIEEEEKARKGEEEIRNDAVMSEPSASASALNLSEPPAVAGGLNAAESNILDDKLQNDNESEIRDLKSGISKTQNLTERTNRRWLVALSVLSILALGAAGFFLWRENGKSADAPIKTIAVLPFKPLAANNRDESLELGMSDTLISRLARLRQITVRPISAVRRYTIWSKTRRRLVGSWEWNRCWRETFNGRASESE